MADEKSRQPFVKYYPAPAPTEEDVKVDDSGEKNYNKIEPES